MSFTQLLLSSPCVEAFDSTPPLKQLFSEKLLAGDKVAAEKQHKQCDPKTPAILETTTNQEGRYLVILSLPCPKPGTCNITANVMVDFRSSYGYLSAVEMPLRLFYGLMTLAYVATGIMWLFFTLRHWRCLLRIQYYITVVIFIGCVEQLSIYAVYEHLNKVGTPIISALFFAEVITCVKRTLARLLVLIVAIGYGINKSRLGSSFKRIVGICSASFVCALVEGFVRISHPRFHPSIHAQIASVPLALIDFIILWWTFSTLVTTMRETKMRRNVVKYRLYRTFSILLIILVIISVIFMVASIAVLRWRPCLMAWRYVWLDEGIWQILFLVMLTAIVVLWRPSSTNRQYANTAFLDTDNQADGDGLEDRLLDSIVDGLNADSSPGPKAPSTEHELALDEDDAALRWAEEHVPSLQPDRTSEAAKREERNPMKLE